MIYFISHLNTRLTLPLSPITSKAPVTGGGCWYLSCLHFQRLCFPWQGQLYIPFSILPAPFFVFYFPSILVLADQTAFNSNIKRICKKVKIFSVENVKKTHYNLKNSKKCINKLIKTNKCCKQVKNG
jgi:hypothetical protein